MAEAQSFVNPLDNPEDYDFCEVAGVENPGRIARGGVTGWKREVEWDVKKGKGTKGGSMTLSQLPPSEGSIKFLLWLPEHFTEWDQSFRAKFKYDPTKKTAEAVDFYHPITAKQGVNSVVTKAIGPETSEGDGLWSITVDLLEYLPPPKKTATGTPTGSKGNGGNDANGKKPDPVADAQQEEIRKLLAEAQKP